MSRGRSTRRSPTTCCRRTCSCARGNSARARTWPGRTRSPHVRRRSAGRVSSRTRPTMPKAKARRACRWAALPVAPNPHQLPEGFGMELKKGSTITFNMHYYKQPGRRHRLLEPGRDRVLLRQGPDPVQGAEQVDRHDRIRDSAAQGELPHRRRRDAAEGHALARLLAACASACDGGAVHRDLS